MLMLFRMMMMRLMMLVTRLMLLTCMLLMMVAMRKIMQMESATPQLIDALHVHPTKCTQKRSH